MLPEISDVQEIALQAGKILRDGYGLEHQIGHKGVVDLVTEVDHLSEALIIQTIQKKFPSHHIIAEESGSLIGSENHCWYIDPLDGTVNYAHGVPIFSVSIAYAYQGRVTLGVVYDPMRDECFTAEDGKGAWLNGRRIQVSPTTELMQSLLVTGFPYDTWASEQNNLEFYSRFARRSQGVRRLGSAALDLAYVASGRFDGYWEIKLSPWDIAAGGLLVAEAGGIVTNLVGQVNYLTAPYSILASNPHIYDQMMLVLQEPQSM